MIEIDDRVIKEVEKTLGQYKAKAPVVLSRALNRAASTTKTAAAKKTKEDYYIKSKEIKDTMKTIKATRGSLGALVTSVGEHVPLDKFRYKPKQPRPHNPPKLQVAVKKDGYKKFPGVFVTDIQGNKIFKRVARERLPIYRVSGPAVPQMLSSEEIREHTEKQAVETFLKRLDHEVKRVLERGKK